MDSSPMNGYSPAMSSKGNMSYIMPASSASSSMNCGSIAAPIMDSSSLRIWGDMLSMSDCIAAICCWSCSMSSSRLAGRFGSKYSPYCSMKPSKSGILAHGAIAQHLVEGFNHVLDALHVLRRHVLELLLHVLEEVLHHLLLESTQAVR